MVKLVLRNTRRGLPAVGRRVLFTTQMTLPPIQEEATFYKKPRRFGLRIAIFLPSSGILK